MKANKFIEKFGWRDAISCIKSCAKPEERWIMHWGSLVADSDFDELKRLVESYELVEKHGGLLSSKYYYEKYKAMGSESNIILFSAIADVESCL